MLGSWFIIIIIIYSFLRLFGNNSSSIIGSICFGVLEEGYFAINLIVLMTLFSYVCYYNLVSCLYSSSVSTLTLTWLLLTIVVFKSICWFDYIDYIIVFNIFQHNRWWLCCPVSFFLNLFFISIWRPE